ncbi:MAG: hypothetical protein HYZ24_09620 [Chloroflexi bacterium]|nr:hypothetical protein [Chloroflexota bacterium]
MKLKIFISPIFIAIIVLAFTNCSPEATMVMMPSETAIPTFTSLPEQTETPKIELVFPSSPTPVPNMAPDKIPLLVAALQDNTCNLPCYLGIIPGKTTLQQGIEILNNLGGIQFKSGRGPAPYQRKSDGALYYPYEFGIGEPLPEGRIIYHDVTLITDNNIVHAVEVSASPNTNEAFEPAVSTYQEYWKRYSLKNIFLQIGEPDSIYSSPKERPNELHAEWFLVYTKKNAHINLRDEWFENKLCPGNRVKVLQMTLSHADSPFSIYADGRVPPTDLDLYFPIKEMFRITAHEFYNKVTENSSSCFDSIVANP